jgi:hypothetical protein
MGLWKSLRLQIEGTFGGGGCNALKRKASAEDGKVQMRQRRGGRVNGGVYMKNRRVGRAG